MRTKKIMQSLAVMLLLVLAGCKDTSQSYPVDLNSSLDTDRSSLQTGQNERLSQMKTNQADCLLLYYPDTLQGLEEHCTYIVRGTVLDGSEQKTIQEDPQDFPYICFYLFVDDLSTIFRCKDYMIFASVLTM